ncbi:MAG: hypothetical protein PVJ80_17865 [Gemmatimonadota bacterium]
MELLKPQLQPYRDEFDRLGRRKNAAFVTGVVLTLPLVAMVPSGLRLATLVVVPAAAVLSLVYYEIRRTLLFRQDVKERKRLGLPLDARRTDNIDG